MRFKRKDQADEHHQKVHDPLMKACHLETKEGDPCPFIAATKDQFNKHIKSSHQLYVCRYKVVGQNCGREFHSKADYNAHCDNVHRLYGCRKRGCQTRFSDPRTQQRHEATCSGTREPPETVLPTCLDAISNSKGPLFLLIPALRTGTHRPNTYFLLT